ncbi:BTG3 protein, partial [Amia calva]|nr:BTG3 protein [Amia calva]
MKREIVAAVHFLSRLIRKLEKQKVEEFAKRLTATLQEKFRGHWYPDNPIKGQAYRCIRVNRPQWEDPELRWACEESRMLFCDLGLPWAHTMWVDPAEVRCRYGDENDAFMV